MPMTPQEIWPMIAGAAVVVFGAGQVVEKIKNGRYVTKDICKLIHKADDDRMTRIEGMISDIHEKLIPTNHKGSK